MAARAVGVRWRCGCGRQAERRQCSTALTVLVVKGGLAGHPQVDLIGLQKEREGNESEGNESGRRQAQAAAGVWPRPPLVPTADSLTRLQHPLRHSPAVKGPPPRPCVACPPPFAAAGRAAAPTGFIGTADRSGRALGPLVRHCRAVQKPRCSQVPLARCARPWWYTGVGTKRQNAIASAEALKGASRRGACCLPKTAV